MHMGIPSAFPQQKEPGGTESDFRIKRAFAADLDVATEIEKRWPS